MGRLRNLRHELFAQALADGKSRGEAMVAAGYPFNRGNQHRLARMPDVIDRLDELRGAADHMVDLRKLDRARVLIELARIACADPPLREAIANNEIAPPTEPMLHVTIRLDGALAKHIEMRLLDDRGALSKLLLGHGEAGHDVGLDFGPAISSDCVALEKILRSVLRNCEPGQKGTANEVR
jgi:hypothetical protein